MKLYQNIVGVRTMIGHQTNLNYRRHSYRKGRGCDKANKISL